MKRNYKTELIWFTIVCLGPALNLLFDYFALEQKPSLVVWTTTVFSLTCLSFYIIFYVKVASKFPFVHEHSKWVCDKPSITYYVGGKRYDDNFAAVEIEGKAYYFRFFFYSSSVDGYELILDEAGDMTYTGHVYFSGTPKYGKNKFTIMISTETDSLFNGKYEELDFHKVS